ncbi:MAG: helix-turn-helix domain-containing protein [Opitutaceae bacterium]
MNSPRCATKSKPPMPKRDLPKFRFTDLAASLRQGVAHAEGKLTARTVVLARKPPTMKPREIAAVRAKLNVSQAVFAELLNVPKTTAVSWERGYRKPSGAALRLLQIARVSPDSLLKTG